MLFKTSDEFAHYHSPYLAIVCAKRFPMIAYLGIESGGRSDRHLEHNLLKPGKGITFNSRSENSFKKPCKVKEAPNSFSYSDIQYKNAGGQKCEISFEKKRTFTIRLSGKGGKITGKFLQMALDPGKCPPSVWGVPLKEKQLYRKHKRASAFSPRTITAYFKTPLLLHFPDFGFLKVRANHPGIYCQEELVPDKTEAGLNLGFHGDGRHHNAHRAYHGGTVLLSFHAPEEIRDAELTFTVEKEHYPQIKGCDFRKPKWDGLKRCWHNAFALNPASLPMGDNILLGGMAHLAIHFKSDMSVFTPPLFGGLPLHNFFRRVLDITFKKCVHDSGEINPGWGERYGYGWLETTPGNLIALYNYLVSTNDWDLVRQNLTNIRKAAGFLIDLDADGDGIIEAPFHGNYLAPNMISRNWWDDFAFGHKDGYTNLLAYRALKNIKKVFDLLNIDDDVQRIDSHLERFEANFHKVFFNKATGVYAGWISKDGRIHDYMFTFISAMAINEGLVETELARRILKKMLRKLKVAGYGEFTYGIPGPLIPVAKPDRIKWEPMMKWGVYENGGLCGQTAYHFIQALYNTGLRKEADRILFTMLNTFEKEFTHSGVFPGFFKSVDWRTKEGIPCGYNYLADNYYFLLAAVTGHYKIPFPQLKKPN